MMSAYMMNQEPIFILDDVKGGSYDLQLQVSTGASAFLLENSKDIDLQKVKGVKDVFIKTVNRKTL